MDHKGKQHKNFDANNKKTIKKKPNKQRRKKQQNKLCSICRRNYSTVASYKTHVYRYHKSKPVEYIPFKMNSNWKLKSDEAFKKFDSTLPSIDNSINIVDQLKKYRPAPWQGKFKTSLTSKITSVFKTNQFKCNYDMCEFVSEDNIQYLEHKKIHSQINIDNFAGVPNTSNMTNYNKRKIFTESHKKVLNGMNLVPHQFKCDLRKTTCETHDHQEFNQWWCSVDYTTLECIECGLQFSKLNDLQLHEANEYAND